MVLNAIKNFISRVFRKNTLVDDVFCGWDGTDDDGDVVLLDNEPFDSREFESAESSLHFDQDEIDYLISLSIPFDPDDEPIVI